MIQLFAEKGRRRFLALTDERGTAMIRIVYYIVMCEATHWHLDDATEILTAHVRTV